MRRLLLDTTFLIDAERAGATLDDALADDDDVAIAAITVAKLQMGVELSKGRRRLVREQFIADVINTLPVIDYDLNVAQAHAVLLAAVRRKGRPRGAHDLIIAATARASERSVLTADAVAFANLPGVTVHAHR